MRGKGNISNLIWIGLVVLVVFLISKNLTNNSVNLTQASCVNAGGFWQECGNKCEIENQGQNVACTALCEQLCTCGGITGFKCPNGYFCYNPKWVMDAIGYCVAIRDD